MAIRPELLKLTSEARVSLADELHDSLEDEVVDPAWERAWTEAIAGRVLSIVEGTAALHDAEDVHAEIRATLSASRRCLDSCLATHTEPKAGAT